MAYDILYVISSQPIQLYSESSRARSEAVRRIFCKEYYSLYGPEL